MSDHTTMILLWGKENYSEWLTNITAILQIKELDDYVTRDNTEWPANLVVDGAIINVDVAQQKTE